MENVRFIDKRFGPASTPFLELEKQTAKAFGYTVNLKTEKHLSQLLRLRVCQKNECAYCAQYFMLIP